MTLSRTERAVSLVRHGLTFKEAAEAVGLSSDTVRHNAVKAGIYKPAFSTDPDRIQKCEEYIRKGYCADVITELCGYKSSMAVHNLAKKLGISVKRKAKLIDEEIVWLRSNGFTCHEIAECTGHIFNNVSRKCREAGMAHGSMEQDYEIRVCAECGNQFKTMKGSRNIFCGLECQRKDRTPKSLDENKAREYLSKHPDYEYVGGYTGSDGYMTVRCKKCGSEFSRSVISIRGNNHIKCECCDRLAAEERQEADRRKREAERFRNRIVKRHKPIQMKECALCGSFFFATGNEKYCGSECRQKSLNHYFSKRKRLKRKNAKTKDSHAITVQSLYRRDNGVCWLCGGQCDFNDYTEENGCFLTGDSYPSVDHVIPLAKGGLDSWDNVKLAHRRCNYLRGDRIVTPHVR